MGLVDVHNHFLPGLDDGCGNVGDSLECLRMMAERGYDRIFCTPHAGDMEADDLTPASVAREVAKLQGAADQAKIPVALRPGGEIRLRPDLCEIMRERGIPTYGNAGKVAVCDLWEHTWPQWATRAVEWLQKQGLQVILAHPERLPYLMDGPDRIDDLARIGLRFQGNLGPIAGADSPRIVTLARRYLREGRYWMVGTDGHRPSHLAERLAGHEVIRELVGEEARLTLTQTHPETLWV